MAKNRDYIKRYKKSNLAEVSLPICFQHAEGAYFYDVEGNAYLDFTSGFGVTSSGWLRKEIADRIQDQLLRSAYAPPWLPSPEATELGEMLLEISPPNLKYCARAIGGADANEIIFKSVFAVSGKKGVLTYFRSYHGGSHFTLGLSDVEKFNLPRVPAGSEVHQVEPPYCYRCPFAKEPQTCQLECLDPIEELLNSNPGIGSFFAEPVLGSGGVIIPPLKYLKRLRALCSEFGVYLVFDEVLTGFGRLGSMTASSHFGIEPDAISYAKGISSGYTAIAAAVMSEELASVSGRYEDVSSTFAWTPLSCCIAKTNIELILRDKLPENAARLGAYLKTEVQNLFQNYFPENLGEVRGLGFMIGIELVCDQISRQADKKLSQKLIVSLIQHNMMVCASWDFQVIILMPPLNMNLTEINEGLNRLELSLKRVSTRRYLA